MKKKKIKIYPLIILLIALLVVGKIISEVMEPEWYEYDWRGRLKSEYYNNERIKNIVQNKMKPFGRSISDGDVTVTMEGYFYEVDEAGNRESGMLFVIDHKTHDFTENDYSRGFDYINTWYFLKENRRYIYGLHIGTDGYYIEIIEGNIYCYIWQDYQFDEFITLDKNEDDSKDLIGHIFVPKSENFHFFDIGAENELVLMDGKILVPKEVTITDMSIYYNDGKNLCIFKDSQFANADIRGSQTEYSSWNRYEYKGIDASNVKYIEINGEKYYPEKLTSSIVK